MSCRIVLWLITTMILLLSHAPLMTLQQEDNPILRECDAAAGNYTSNSQFETNLVTTLLPSLASQAPLRSSTFYNTTVGQGSDRIFGFAQCMSASTAQECGACLNQSVAAVLGSCSFRRQAMVRYYNCILHYSDQPFLSQLDTYPVYIVGPVANASEPALFNQQLGILMRKLFTESAYSPSRFAVGNINYTDLIDIYGLAQCTKDLSSSDCYICLDQAIMQISGCCMNRQGGNIYYPSCNIRYEVYAFRPAYGLSPPPPSPSPPPDHDAASPPTSAANPPQSTGIRGNGRGNRRRITTIVVAVAVAVALLILVCCLWVARRGFLRRLIAVEEREDIEDERRLLFDLDEIRFATNNFSHENILGQGGFGPVYKGKLSDGQEIAVKRLLASSSQGITELRNEVASLARLEHRNLVRLLGCCLEEGEKLLIYVFVPNSSLEKFLFDPVRSSLLKWEHRYKIVGGIARGLLYLHEDSRLRIIHRDLKASNILLDSEMNPKISDFGLAKIFEPDQTRGNTSRIAGTFGYMAPEYAMHGRFSTKSDVFSIGVLILEIVTGRKNSDFHESGGAIDLLTLVWRHWSEGGILELIDANMGTYPRNQVVRCIHLGLLCVQEDAMERPTMSTIVLMLSSHSISLPRPLPPAFCMVRRNSSSTNHRTGSQSSGSEYNNPVPESVNEASTSDPYPR